MAGYTRQSSADIIATAVVRANPLNVEYNALRDAFNASTGHKHDGTAAEGAYVPLIADSDALNKVVIDTSNNRVGVFVEVSSAAVEQIRIQDGAVVPVTNNDIDLGTSSLQFKDLFIDGTANIDSLVADTADINAGTIDGVTIGGSSAAAGTFTALAATGTSTLTTVDINGGAIDGTIIGANSATSSTFTTATTTGLATLATADINGGTIDGAVIGGSSALAITGTVVTASTNFAGALTGNVTGNVTGNSAGTHTGAVIGDVTGNVTAASGTSSFNNLTVNGTLNMNAGTSATIENLSAPSNANDAARKADVDAVSSAKLNLSGGTMSGDIAMGGNTVSGLGAPSASADAATKGYVDTSVSNLVDSAPGTLDTLNELAAALGDDPDFATTITNSIATKLPLAGGTMTGDIVLGSNKATSTATPATDDTLTRKGYVDTQDALKLNLAGGTMSGAIAMGTNKITGLGDPTANQDASTKAYTDTQRDTRLPLAGGTMTGGITMGNNKVTATYTPSANADLTTKTYVDGILGSATSAATSASAAATSATNAASSATASASSASAAAASYDSFDDRYLGAKSSAPSVDNDGNALLTGALYWNTSNNSLFLWTGSAWSAAAFDTSGALVAVNNLSDLNNAATARTNLGFNTGVDAHLNTSTAANGEFLSWNGSDYDWAAVASGAFDYTRATKTANYTVVAGDLGKIIDVTSNSVTISLTAAATLGDGFYVYIRNSSSTATDVVTIDGNGSETIDGSPLIYLRRFEGIHLVCDGSGFFSLRSRVDGLQTNFAQQSHQNGQPTASGANSLALGFQTDATNQAAISVGYQTAATGSSSMAFGNYSTASGQNALTVGMGALASDTNSVAIGSGSGSEGPRSQAAGAVAIGRYSKVVGTDGIAGPYSYISGNYGSVAFGVINTGTSYGSQGNYSVSIGQLAKATAANSIAIGDTATSTVANLIALGGTTDTVKISGAYTLPTADGSANQVLTTNGSGAVTFADAGGGAEAYTRDTKTANYTVVAGDLGKIIDVTSNSVTLTMTSAATLGAGFYVYIRNSSTTNGHVVTVVGTSSQTINGSPNGRKLYRNEFIQLVCDGSNFYSLRSETPGLSTNLELPNSLGNEPDASGLNSICLGFESSATGVRSFTAGYQADATGDRATALGYSATASGTESPLAIGDSVASGSYAIAIGPDASASNTEAIAIGRNASATGSIGIALGHDTKTTGAAATSINVLNHNYGAKSTYSIAIGYFSTVSNSYGMALGPTSACQGYSGIAIGNGAAVYNMGDGANYAVAFGRSVDVRAHNAFGLGHQTAIPTVRGKYAYSSGSFTSTGDAQTGTFVLKSDTTDATAEALTTNNSTAAANNQITLPNNSAYSFSGTIIARESAAAGSDYASWEIKGALLRDANAASTVLGNGIQNKLYATSGASAWAIALSADTTNGGLKIEVTGAASTNIRWVATVNTSEVTYA